MSNNNLPTHKEYKAALIMNDETQHSVADKLGKYPVQINNAMKGIDNPVSDRIRKSLIELLHMHQDESGVWRAN